MDVSEHGLGLLSAEEISLGETLTLEIGDEKVVFEVVWSKPDFGKFDLIRYGLVCTSENKNIAEIFSKAGMLSWCNPCSSSFIDTLRNSVNKVKEGEIKFLSSFFCLFSSKKRFEQMKDY